MPRHHYRPLAQPASCCSLPPGLDWDYAETPPHERVRPGVVPSQYAFGIIWTGRQLTREECQRFRLAPHNKPL